MTLWISEQAFSRLQIRDKMSVPDGTRTTNLVMACHLMFLYSNYRLIGIAHQQATQPMTEQEANERACLLNGLFNADLSGYDFLGNSETAVDDAIDRYQDYEKLKDKICEASEPLKKNVNGYGTNYSVGSPLSSNLPVRLLVVRNL